MLIEDSIKARKMLRISECRLKTAEEPTDSPENKRTCFRAINHRKMVKFSKRGLEEEPIG
jgi:hypothetical protein